MGKRFRNIEPLRSCKEGRFYEVEKWVADGKPRQIDPRIPPSRWRHPCARLDRRSGVRDSSRSGNRRCHTTNCQRAAHHRRRRCRHDYPLGLARSSAVSWPARVLQRSISIASSTASRKTCRGALCQALPAPSATPFVLEGDLHFCSIGINFPVLELHIELSDFGNAQVSQALSR